MNIKLIFIGISLSLGMMYGCKKERSTTPKFDNYFILEHYSGHRDTFKFNGEYSLAFSFYNYRATNNPYSDKYVKKFDLFKNVFSDNYELVLATPENAITINQVYRSNNTTQRITSFTQTVLGPNDIITSATSTDIQFTEYNPNSRISGSFKAYSNSSLWFKGTFSFNPIP